MEKQPPAFSKPSPPPLPVEPVIESLLISSKQLYQLAGKDAEAAIERLTAGPSKLLSLATVGSAAGALHQAMNSDVGWADGDAKTLLFAATAGLALIGQFFWKKAKLRRALKRHIKLRDEVTKFNQAVENLRTHLKVMQVLKPGVQTDAAILQQALRSLSGLRESLVSALKLDRIFRENPRYQLPDSERIFIPYESTGVLEGANELSTEWQSIFDTANNIQERLAKDFGVFK